jgi:primase-polymerase (primpol)-like protein
MYKNLHTLNTDARVSFLNMLHLNCGCKAQHYEWLTTTAFPFQKWNKEKQAESYNFHLIIEDV